MKCVCIPFVHHCSCTNNDIPNAATHTHTHESFVSRFSLFPRICFAVTYAAIFCFRFTELADVVNVAAEKFLTEWDLQDPQPSLMVRLPFQLNSHLRVLYFAPVILATFDLIKLTAFF